MCARRGGGPAWLRLRAYGAAPGEHVLQAVGGEFALSASARSLRQSVPGGLAALLLLVLVVFAVLRWQPPLIAISTVGLPLVFLSYLRRHFARIAVSPPTHHRGLRGPRGASTTTVFSFVDSGLREVSPTADRRNDCVVSLKNKIVELRAGDGAQKVKLVGGIGSGEDVQRPVPDRRAPQMRMVETDPVVGHQHDR